MQLQSTQTIINFVFLPQRASSLRQMECPLALFHGREELLPQDFNARVIGELEVIHASHDAGQVVVRRVGWFTRLANHSEHGRKLFEACCCREHWLIIM